MSKNQYQPPPPPQNPPKLNVLNYLYNLLLVFILLQFYLHVFSVCSSLFDVNLDFENLIE